MAWYNSIWRNENCKRFCQRSCIISHLPPILHWMFTTRKCQIPDNFDFAKFRIHSIFVCVPVDLDFSRGGDRRLGYIKVIKSGNNQVGKSRDDRVNAIRAQTGRRTTQLASDEKWHDAGILWHGDTVRDMALASPLLWLICANLRCTFSLIFVVHSR